MALVIQVNDGDPGIVCRTNWNEALRSVDLLNGSLQGNGTPGNPLYLTVDNDCALPTDSQIFGPSVDAVKCYIQDQISSLLGFFTWKSFSFKTNPGSSGTDYVAGYYFADEDEGVLDQGSSSLNWGSLDVSYGARFFVVIGDIVVTDGTFIQLELTGTSVDDLGNVTPLDTEVIVADATAASLNDYFQTTKQWLGIVTLTATSDGANFSVNFNYGYAKFEEDLPTGFTIQAVEVVGLARANDDFFDFQLLLHNPAAGWVFASAGFVPNATNIITSIFQVQGNYQHIDANEYFAFHHIDLNYPIPTGAGVLCRVITTGNNPVNHMDIHIKGSF